MPVAKLGRSGALSAVKSEASDSLDTFLRQAIGKEPHLPFSRTGDGPVEWIQLLHALDQPDIPGWPLMSPAKVQMLKCDKCSREYCSSINYRRHIRVHRRSLIVNKEFHKNRGSLAAYWDKLSREEVTEVVSFTDVMLQEIPGSSLLRSLAASLRKPGVWSLPHVHVRAGSILLDIIQAKPPNLPIPAEDLFSVLDEASEGTFLCAGTAESVQKYVFDGDTAKNCLELKNLVASTCFLFERQLVKAWVADQDAEALRCHKLLVEEEEAAQKRQAMILERKKQKKLRQKEQKVKERFSENNGDVDITVVPVDAPESAEVSEVSTPSDSSMSNLLDVPSSLDYFLESMQFQSKESEVDIEAQIDLSTESPIDQEDTQTNEPQLVSKKNPRQLTMNRWQVSKPQRGGRPGPHVGQNLQTTKPENQHKLGPTKDWSLPNGSRVWTKKYKADSDAGSLRPHTLQGENTDQLKENNCEVIIGSIPVTLKSFAQHHDNRPGEAKETRSTEPTTMVKKNGSEKVSKADNVQSVTNSGPSKLWRPVSRGETIPVNRSNQNSEVLTISEKIHDRVTKGDVCIQPQSWDGDDSDNRKQCHVTSDGNTPNGSVPFCSIAAKEFLAKRWKEAISADHVKLVLSSRPEPPNGGSDEQHNISMSPQSADIHECSVLGNAENQVGQIAQAKSRKKTEKNLKIKYIPKQKVAV